MLNYVSEYGKALSVQFLDVYFTAHCISLSWKVFVGAGFVSKEAFLSAGLPPHHNAQPHTKG